MASSTSSIIESLFHHVVLPTRLPGARESSIDETERALTDRLLAATRTLRDLASNEGGDQWDSLCRSFQICRVVNAGGRLNTRSLSTEFRSLERNDLLILHITEQNAGLLIRRQHEQVPPTCKLHVPPIWLTIPFF